MRIRYSILFLLFVGSLNILANNLLPESYWDIQSVKSPLVSPDGENIIYATRYIDKKNDSYITELWIMEDDGSNQRFFFRWIKSSMVS